MSESRQYELIYVLSPEMDEEGVKEFHTQISEIVENLGGEIETTDNWGRRRLAYEIKKHREGTYVLELINGPGAMVGELERRLRVNDQVLRHIVVRVDEDLRKAKHVRDRRQGKVERRRAARGLTSTAVAKEDDKVEALAPESAAVAKEDDKVEASAPESADENSAAPETEVGS